jgi:hypothetical protein
LTATDEQLLLATPAARPCTHRRVRHEHGTEGRYARDGCRCLPCRSAHERYRAAHPAVAVHGRWLAFADAGPVRAHVHDLMRGGLSWQAVAHRAGLSRATVKTLIFGRNGAPVVRVRARTARLLLAVEAGRHRTPQRPDLLTMEAIP